MKRFVFLAKFVFVLALGFVLSACVFLACEKKDGSYLGKALMEKAKNTPFVSLETVGEMHADRPTLVVFHGETDENETFTLDIPLSVYTEDVTYRSESVNASTLGFKARGLKEKTGYYDLTSYWTDVAKYNVVLVHAEKYFAFDEDECVAKIYSAYRSGYAYDGGKYVEVNADYSIAEIASALVYDALKNAENKEIRFLGYGVGANLASNAASYLFHAYENGVKDSVLPTRVTLCDPYLSEVARTYTVSWSDESMEKGVGGAACRDAKYLDRKGVALEWIATEEAGVEKSYYAYDGQDLTSDSEIALCETSTSLLFSETYSLHASFAQYKKKRRVAFDWYVYSVIGSDDAQDYGYDSQKYAIGYPHTYMELSSEAAKSSVNWSYDLYGDARRPILNDRAKNNDERNDAGARYGKNFAVGAWTPTNYIRGLRGVSFTQREGQKVENAADVFGNNVYTYTKKPLSSFRSENYQYSDLGKSTVFMGRVYVDVNENGWLDDGHSGKKATVFVTITQNDGKILMPRTQIETDDNGYYYVLLKDAADETEPFTYELDGNVVRCAGYSLVGTDDGFIYVKTELYVPKGYSAVGDEANGYWYDTSRKNNAKNGVGSVEISPYKVHSVVLYNSFLWKEA